MSGGATVQYKPYPAYKASGVEWLGSVPEHWHEKRLKYACRLNPARDVTGLPPGAPVSFLPMEKVGTHGELQLDDARAACDLSSGYTAFREEDVLVAKITPCFENGKGALCKGLSNGLGFGSTEFHVLRAGKLCDSRFVYWLTVTDAFRRLGTTSMTGVAGQQRVSTDFLANYLTPLPPLPEQRAIADFLDRETGRIDALIAKKRRLIELLEEKRSALISHAVTKGLDPNAPMKDSGIEWLGQIPAHWEVKPLKFAVEQTGAGIQMGPFGGMLKDLNSLDTGCKVYGQENTISGNFESGSRWISPDRYAAMSQYTLRPGDIVLTRKGSIGNDSCEGGQAQVGCTLSRSSAARGMVRSATDYCD